jgi:hypothetical protein
MKIVAGALALLALTAGAAYAVAPETVMGILEACGCCPC